MKSTKQIQTLPDIDSEISMEVLYQARTSHSDRQRFLRKRRRARNFHTGKQWLDPMTDPDTGDTITEEEWILKDRRVPTQNNQINPVVRNMVGRFRENYTEPIAYGRNRFKPQAREVMTSSLRKALDTNEAKELDARNIEEFMLSAGAGWKTTYRWWAEFNASDVYIEKLDQTRFFFNADSEDIRTHDVWIVGEIHDMRMDDVIAAFARNKSDVEKLKNMFPFSEGWEGQISQVPAYISQYRSFYVPSNPDKVRVIEVWRKEFEWLEFVHDRARGKYIEVDKDYFFELGFDEDIIDRYSASELIDIYNQQELERAEEMGADLNQVPYLQINKRYEPIWKCYFLSPMGNVLQTMRTPYKHQEHPYTFGYFPLIDGETYSLVDSIIDQQKHINRLISLLDTSLAKSVKNLMFVPESIVPDKFKGDHQAFADQAVTYNGMIFYKPRQDVTDLPKVIKQNSMPVGAHELLSLQMGLMNEISAVNDAVRGEQPQSNTPASLYAQRTANASVTNKDYFDFFMSLLRKRNRKVIQVMKQFYQEKRYIKIAGTGFDKDVSNVYDPELVSDIDFDVILGEMENTLAYRQAVDQYLYEFLKAQLITLEEFLENASMPFADSLLETIKNRSQSMMQGGVPGMPQDPAGMMQQQLAAQQAQSAIQQPMPQPTPTQMLSGSREVPLEVLELLNQTNTLP